MTDQAPTFQEGNEDCGIIKMHNLDKCASMLTSHYRDIIERLIGLDSNTTSANSYKVNWDSNEK